MSTLTEYLRDALQGKIKGGIKPSLGQKEVPLNQITSGIRTRLFASNSSGENPFSGFLENSAAKSLISNLKELIDSKKISIPLNEASVKIIMDELSKMSNDVLNDNEFNTFLDNHFREHNIIEQAVKDQIKNELIRAYRFQALTSAAKALYKSTEGLSGEELKIISQENHYAKCVNALMQQCNIAYLSYTGNVNEFIEKMENYYTNNNIPPNNGLLVDIKEMFDRIKQGSGGTLSTNDIMIRRIAAQVLGPQKSIEIVLKYFNTLQIEHQQQIIKFFNDNKSGNTNTPEAKQLFDALNAQFLKNAPELANSAVQESASVESDAKTGMKDTAPKKQSFVNTFVGGVRAVWNAVQNWGAKLTIQTTSPKVEGRTKTTEGVVTPSEGKKQGRLSTFISGVKSAWQSVKSAFVSPTANETSKTVEGKTTVNTGEVSAIKKSTSGSSKVEVTFAGMDSLNNPFEKHPQFEMDLKIRINGSLRIINLVQKYFTSIDINSIAPPTRNILLNDDYGPLAENIMALGELKKSADERQLTLISLAERQILLHLDKCIKEQDEKINSTIDPKDIEQFRNSKNALLFIRDKIAEDLKLQLPEDTKYVSFDKPNQVSKKFVGERYQQMNSKTLIEHDIHDIHNQLQQDITNINQKIAENSGKSSPEIKKALMELHINLNAFKDQVNKLHLEPECQLLFEEPKGPKEMILDSINKMEEQARDIYKQTLDVEKKGKWQNIASSNLKAAGSNLKRSMDDLSQSLSERVGKSHKKQENASPYVSVDNPTMESHSEPTTPRSMTNSEPTTPRIRGR